MVVVVWAVFIHPGDVGWMSDVSYIHFDSRLCNLYGFVDLLFATSFFMRTKRDPMHRNNIINLYTYIRVFGRNFTSYIGHKYDNY